MTSFKKIMGKDLFGPQFKTMLKAALFWGIVILLVQSLVGAFIFIFVDPSLLAIRWEKGGLNEVLAIFLSINFWGMIASIPIPIFLYIALRNAARKIPLINYKSRQVFSAYIGVAFFLAAFLVESFAERRLTTPSGPVPLLVLLASMWAIPALIKDQRADSSV